MIYQFYGKRGLFDHRLPFRCLWRCGIISFTGAEWLVMILRVLELPALRTKRSKESDKKQITYWGIRLRDIAVK